jgi:hypothetical protein
MTQSGHHRRTSDGQVINQEWTKNQHRTAGQLIPPGGVSINSPVDRIKALLREWAQEFAARRRPDVGSAGLSLGKIGLGEDGAAAFLRAVDAEIVTVDT